MFLWEKNSEPKKNIRSKKNNRKNWIIMLESEFSFLKCQKNDKNSSIKELRQWNCILQSKF